MAQKQSWNSKFGIKGFAFSLDAALAVFVIVLLIAVSTDYVNKSDEAMPNLQVYRVGSDVINVLRIEGKLNDFKSGNFSWDVINGSIHNILPSNYEMRVKYLAVPSYYKKKKGGKTITGETGDNIPNDRFVASGKVIFLADKVKKDLGYYVIAQYWVWEK